MKTAAFTVIAWSAAGMLVIACVGWWFTSSSLAAAAQHYAQKAADAQQSAARDTEAARLGTLARDTEDVRTRLDALSAVDVLSAAKAIEAVGPSAHVDLRVTGATAANVSSKASASPLRPVLLAFEAQGTFAHVLQAAKLLSTLPMPATLEQFDMEKIFDDSKKKAADAPWRLNGQIRLFTKATITP